MSMKFDGTIEELKYLVKSTGIRGKWSEDGSGKHTYRSTEGGVLNWWTNGTVNFQGKTHAQLMLKRSLLKHFTTITTHSDFIEADYELVSQRHHHTNPANCSGDTLSLLPRIINTLSISGFLAHKINDSTYVVSDSSGRSHCFLHQKLFEILLPE